MADDATTLHGRILVTPEMEAAGMDALRECVDVDYRDWPDQIDVEIDPEAATKVFRAMINAAVGRSLPTMPARKWPSIEPAAPKKFNYPNLDNPA